MILENNLNAQERVIEEKIEKAKKEISRIKKPILKNTLNEIIGCWGCYAELPEGYDHAIEVYKKGILPLIKEIKKYDKTF
jgi:hypothetical protein